ncbi:MAG: hypothetical protein F4187_09485, partial [Gemmatimonadetes bacterium]|nr:hypothetical protein [Gemmatimonadota bacterium]
MGGNRAVRDRPEGRRRLVRARFGRAGLTAAAVSGAVGLMAAVLLAGVMGIAVKVHLSGSAGEEAGRAGPSGGADGPADFGTAAPPGVLRFGGGEASPGTPGVFPEPGVLRFGSDREALAVQYPREWHEFYFTRAAYSSWRGGRGGRCAPPAGRNGR